MKLFDNPIALIVVLIIVMMIFGIDRVPEVGKSLGKTLRSYREGVNSDEKFEIDELIGKEKESGSEKALAIAKERFEKGELTKEEYEELIKNLG
jgi:sec-independent protein translocase protein TatA